MRSETKKRRSYLHSEGFTSLELLVVILIIGLLAGIAIPTFLSSHNYAPTVMKRLVADEQTVYSQHGKYGSLVDLQSADPSLGKMIKNDGADVNVITGVVTPSAQITVTNNNGTLTRLLR